MADQPSSPASDLSGVRFAVTATTEEGATVVRLERLAARLSELGTAVSSIAGSARLSAPATRAASRQALREVLDALGDVTTALRDERRALLLPAPSASDHE